MITFTVRNLNAWLALIFGILVLVNPRLLSVLVGLYLIIVGLTGLGIIRF